jgi:hypothetical protein
MCPVILQEVYARPDLTSYREDPLTDESIDY